MAKRFARLVATVGILWAARPAHADDTHYQDYIVGGRAIGMGGAFAAISDDPSGLYYNPAGIADVHRANVQLSTSLYGFESGSIERVPFETLALNFTDLVVIPASAGFVSAFGDRGDDGLPIQAFGVSVLVPSYRNYSASSGNEQRSYTRHVTDNELWAGIGYARQLRRGWRLGLSAYYVVRSLSDREQVTSFVPGDGVTRGATFESINDDFELTVGNIVPVLGAKYTPSSEWAFGASVQLPSLQINSSGVLTYLRAAANPAAALPDQSSFQSGSYPGMARMRYAAALRVGGSYKRSHRFTVAMDMRAHAPIDYTLLNVESGPANNTLFSPNVQRHAVVNFNIGGEYLVIREVSLSAGVFSDFSSAPRIPAQPTTAQQPSVDLMGLSMALSYIGDYTLSRLGLVYSFGQGDDVVPGISSSTAEQTFTRATYFQSFFYVFLSSSFRY